MKAPIDAAKPILDVSLHFSHSPRSNCWVCAPSRHRGRRIYGQRIGEAESEAPTPQPRQEHPVSKLEPSTANGEGLWKDSNPNLSLFTRFFTLPSFHSNVRPEMNASPAFRHHLHHLPGTAASWKRRSSQQTAAAALIHPSPAPPTGFPIHTDLRRLFEQPWSLPATGEVLFPKHGPEKPLNYIFARAPSGTGSSSAPHHSCKALGGDRVNVCTGKGTSWPGPEVHMARQRSWRCRAAFLLFPLSFIWKEQGQRSKPGGEALFGTERSENS